MTTSMTTSSIADRIARELSGRVRSSRERHIHRVAALMDQLAQRFLLDRERARLAALAHDMDREMPPWRAYALIADWEIPVLAVERSCPKMLHGPISAERLRREYGVTDMSILHAVRFHTLGDASLDDLGLALFIADSCEPGRKAVSDSRRAAILAAPTLEAIAIAAIEMIQERYGPLEEATRQLYARLQGET